MEGKETGRIKKKEESNRRLREREDLTLARVKKPVHTSRPTTVLSDDDELRFCLVLIRFDLGDDENENEKMELIVKNRHLFNSILFYQSSLPSPFPSLLP